MIVVIICSFIAILLTFLESKDVLKRGMLYGFILVTLLGCIHYKYGNDYDEYMTWFKMYSHQKLSLDNILNDYNWDPGWVVLNHVFDRFGFFALVAFINIVLNIIYFCIIKNNVEKEWRPFAVSIYLLSTSLYLLNFSMMRQGMAVALFFAAWPFIRKGRLIPSLLTILIAASFHKSALLLLPFALLGKAKLRNASPIAILMLALLLSLYFSTTLAPEIFISVSSFEYFFANDQVDYYMTSQLLERTYSLGFVLNLLPFIIGIILMIKKVKYPDDNILIILCLMSFIVAPFGNVLTMLLRFSYYFVAYQVIGIPRMYSMITRPKLRVAAIGIYCVMLLYGYLVFFSDPVWEKSYSEFHTIFEVI